MNLAQNNRPPIHVLIYEPRVEGHHVGFLKFVSEDLLGAGYRLTLAIDLRPEPLERIRAQMADVLTRVAVIPAGPAAARATGGPAGPVAACLAQSGADFAFLNNFDEIGSALLRRAALGLLPPASLRGRLGGIYHRPRFLGRLGLSPNLWIKALGFERLRRGGWFSHLLLLDPYLHAELKARHPTAPVFFLPDSYPENFGADRAEARRRFDLPEDRRVFLFYGGAYRRKGLGLAVEAMLTMPATAPAFLLCAGQQVHDRKAHQGLEKLIAQGRAQVINRYVSSEEERQLFAASDVVLLPYHKHFGISGVLMRAIGAGLPAIVSDEELLGRLVREHGLGLLFSSGEVAALRGAIEHMARAPDHEMSRYQAAARAYAPRCSRAAFRDALVSAFKHGTGEPAA